MNQKKVVVVIWIAVNLILGITFFWDATTIQCEPCLPNTECLLVKQILWKTFGCISVYAIF